MAAPVDGGWKGSLMHPPLTSAIRRFRPARSRRGFSITELLVVIGIIVLLVGLLLPALAAAQQKGRATQTNAVMEQFRAACESFHQKFGFYPGAVPEAVLTADPRISGTENAILHLMGGFLRQEDDPGLYAQTTGPDWKEIVFSGPSGQYRLKVNVFEIGKGPRIGGQQYLPFFSPKGSELRALPGQYLTEEDFSDGYQADSLRLPDLVDGWGQPIIYVRSLRDSGPLVGTPGPGVLPQFSRSSMAPYLNSVALGEAGKSQATSVLRLSSPADSDGNFAQIIRHPGFGAANKPLEGKARGAFVLLSAGKDGVFFASTDGPGTQAAPVTNLVNLAGGPSKIDEYDDLRQFGGS